MNVYINFHRPYLFPVPVMESKGKLKKIYPYDEVKTPYEKLKSIPEAENHLRPGVSFQSLDAIAYQMSDNEFAERMVKARFDLFQEIHKSLERVPSRPKSAKGGTSYPHIHTIHKERNDYYHPSRLISGLEKTRPEHPYVSSASFGSRVLPRTISAKSATYLHKRLEGSRL
ncbi:MAG: hypothetical protein ACLFPU_11015 [Dehalococcoidia bacterium]